MPWESLDPGVQGQVAALGTEGQVSEVTQGTTIGTLGLQGTHGIDS
jgi:hypothetical protein